MVSYDAKTIENKCPFCEIGAGRLQTATFWEDSEFINKCYNVFIKSN